MQNDVTVFKSLAEQEQNSNFEYNSEGYAKERMICFLDLLKEPIKTYLFHQHRIETNKCGNPTIIQQASCLLFESKQITHWIVPTPELITTSTPHEYAFKVLVLNPKTGFFDTMYPKGEKQNEQKCIEYVLHFQEAKYGFSWKENREARSQLDNYYSELNELCLLVDEEFNKQHNEKLEELYQNIRIELGIMEKTDQ